MLDVLFVVEWAWCSLLVGTRGLQLAAYSAGGLIASIYAASHLSGWMAATFTPPSSSAFLWLENHLSTAPDVLSALSAFTPPTAVSTGSVPLRQAVAYQVLHTLFYLSITAALFTLFIMVWHLSNALWDRTPVSDHGQIPVATALSLFCGACAVLLTGVLVGNIAWLQGLPFLAQAVHHSLTMQWTASLARRANVL